MPRTSADPQGKAAAGSRTSPPAVAIVGVPNVGKSTLFNRLIGRRHALVGDRPGLTRDRIEAEASIGDRTATVIDTGGIVRDHADDMAVLVRQQAETAVAGAAAVLLVVSARAGLLPQDHEIAQWLRRSGRPTLVIANKVDRPEDEDLAAEFHALGLGDPFPVSAEHGLGLGAVIDRLRTLLPEASPAAIETPPSEVRRIAFVGRQNVGKSSLVNCLAQEERSVVSEIAGTTRDTVDVALNAGGHEYRILDTAGLRRNRRAADRIETLAAGRAMDTLRFADVVLLVLDGSVEISMQDQSVAGLAQRSGRPLVLIVNKWDLVPQGEAAREGMKRQLAERFRFARYAPVVFVSARTGAGVNRILPEVEAVWRNGSAWVGAGRLNRFLQKLQALRPGRGSRGEPMRCFYIAQTGIRPPAFTLFSNLHGPADTPYRRFVENRLRLEFGFDRTPVVLHWKRK
jgi:GTP-binding protein